MGMKKLTLQAMLFVILILTCGFLSADDVSVSSNSTLARSPDITLRDGYVFIGFTSDRTGRIVDFPYRNESPQSDTLRATYVPIEQMFDCYKTIWGTYVITGVKQNQDYCTSIILPDNVIRIARNAFSEAKFKSVAFSESAKLRYIDAYAFENSPIESVTLPPSLEMIGEGAFRHSSLRSIIIPSSVAVLEPFTFEGCLFLEAVTIDAPSDMTIGDACFRSSALSSIYLPDGSVVIGAEAFRGLQSSAISFFCTGEIEIGAYAFCQSTVRISNLDKVTMIGDYAFYESRLSSLHDGRSDDQNILTISAGSIGDFAFCNAAIEFDLVLMPNVSMLGEAAFSYCEVADVDFSGASLTSISSNAFRESSIESIVFPKNLRSIGNAAFGRCGQLRGVDLPNTVVSIGDFAFYGCSMTYANLGLSLVSIGAYAFAYNSLESITLPSTMNSIASAAFKACPLYPIPDVDSVDYVAQDAFDNYDGVDT